MIFGGIFTSCEPTLQTPPPVPQAATPPIEQLDTNTVTLTDTSEVTLSEDDVVITGEAYFFKDSVQVRGENFLFQRGTPYGRVLIIFDEDGKIAKVETMTALRFKQLDKNTIFISKGCTLTEISRHFSIPIHRLLDCNPGIKNPNKIPALTKFKLNCE